MEISCLWGLRWSLPALILAPTFFEIREGGLQFVRFGFVPWSSIGRIWLMAYSTGPAQSSGRTCLYIKVADLPDRIRALPWWSRIERSLLTLGTKARFCCCLTAG